MTRHFSKGRQRHKPGVISEKEFTTQVIQLARLHGWKTAHFRPGMNRRGEWQTAVQGDGVGFPDLVLVRETVLWVELKTDKGKMSPAQCEWGQDLIRAGQQIFTWRPSDWELIKDILEITHVDGGER